MCVCLHTSVELARALKLCGLGGLFAAGGGETSASLGTMVKGATRRQQQGGTFDRGKMARAAAVMTSSDCGDGGGDGSRGAGGAGGAGAVTPSSHQITGF